MAGRLCVHNPDGMAVVDERVTACALAFADALLAARDCDQLPAVEQVLRARLSLFDCLVEAGWGPPPAARSQVDRDRRLLREPQGALPA